MEALNIQDKEQKEQITDSNQELEDISVCPNINKNSDVLIIFTNSNCDACKDLINELDNLEVDNSAKIPEEIYILDENSGCSNLFDLFNIRMYPTAIRIKDSKAYIAEGYDMNLINKLITFDNIDSEQVELSEKIFKEV